MLHKLNLENILFLDIETVPEQKNFNDLTDEMKYLWADKTKYQRKEDFSAEEYFQDIGYEYKNWTDQSVCSW